MACEKNCAYGCSAVLVIGIMIASLVLLGSSFSDVEIRSASVRIATISKSI
jgi:hypothetical protein